MSVVAPMFPLGSVLLPHMMLPLHVFEPRYRVMFEELVGELPRPADQTELGPEPRFGVVMIERGSEVGGGDQRARVATMAEVVGAQLLEDGRWGVVAVGGERIRVLEWLDDDPYPLALVEPWPDVDGVGTSRFLRTELEAVRARHDELVALLARLGVPVDEEHVPDWAADPVQVIWQVALASPLGSLDRQRLLSAPGSAERIGLLAGMIDEQIELVRSRLA